MKPAPWQRPALERAIPSDTNSRGQARTVSDSWEVRFGGGTGWRHATAIAWWRDDTGRQVVQLDWAIGGEHWQDAFLADPAGMRPYPDDPPEFIPPEWSPR